MEAHQPRWRGHTGAARRLRTQVACQGAMAAATGASNPNTRPLLRPHRWSQLPWLPHRRMPTKPRTGTRANRTELRARLLCWMWATVAAARRPACQASDLYVPPCVRRLRSLEPPNAGLQG